QDYESLESKGLGIWDMGQNSDRWKVFRLNTASHNVLMIDDKAQVVTGYAKLDKTSDQEAFKYAVSDISAIYSGQVKSAKRGAAIVDEKYVVIQDEVEALNTSTKIRWAMFTPASVSLATNSAILTIGSKKLTVKVNGSTGVTMKTW